MINMSDEDRLESIELYLKSIYEISQDLSDCKNKELIKEGITMINIKSYSALNIVKKLRGD